MKYMIASDIHGSAYDCGRLLEALAREGADRLVLLGDLLYHGPRNAQPRQYDPMAVAQLLGGVKEKVLAVRGNCDSEVDQAVLPFPILADYAVLALGRRLVYATHGHVHNTCAPPPLSAGDILLHGHTHVPAWQRFGDGLLYLNPGSVAIPKEDSRRGYMLLEADGACWRTLEGETFHELAL